MLTQEELVNLQTACTKVVNLAGRMIEILDCITVNSDSISQIIATKKSIPIEHAIDQISQFSGLRTRLTAFQRSIEQIQTIDPDVSEPFKAFLLSEFTSFNWNQYSLTDAHSTRAIKNFVNRQSTVNILPEDAPIIGWVCSIPERYNNITGQLENKLSTFNIFSQIRNISGNIVMIGANGAGKSTFARQLKGKLTAKNITILSSQHLLVYSKPDSIPAAGDEIEKVRSFQRDDKLSYSQNFAQTINSDMNQLITALIAQHIDYALKSHGENGGIQKENSVLEKTIQIWGRLIDHRTLNIERTGISVKTTDGVTYPFNNLSDGEKAVFYYVGHILLAADDSYIIIDEPENHFHLAICNKLWDQLEAERPDSSFIYLTHNIDFAMSRTNSSTIWNKRFTPPDKWSFELLEPDAIIPDALMMEIIGSRKDICFCEGNDKNSLDYKLYSILFPNLTIIPSSGHRNVSNRSRVLRFRAH